MGILPTTHLGKWSAKLIAAFFLLLGTTMVVVSVFHQEGGETFSDNLLISIPMFGAALAAMAAFVTGIISVWKYKERSIFVFITIAIGFLVLFFVLGEITSSH